MDTLIALTAAAPMVAIFSLCIRNMHLRLAGVRSEGTMPALAGSAVRVA